ncbi:MAG: hypothetical protein ABIB55_01685 [Candidatus Nealsonbacteria bacterium]
MRITFQSQENIQNIMRRCGYFFVREERGELAFVRPLSSSGSGYPRFHAYVKVDGVSREIIFNLHLDQKKPIYRGTTAHAGEYDGEIVVNEIERLKKILGL